MRNIEVKARITNMEDAERIASVITGDMPPVRFEQTDTYFNVPKGRLKLREHRGEETRDELIFYLRPNEPGPKPSDYWIVETREPTELKSMLSSALGINAVVTKERTVFFFQNVRIHLDSVVELGTFLEFEEVLPEGSSQPGDTDLIKQLMREFSIKKEDLIGESYCDLIAGNKSTFSG